MTGAGDVVTETRDVRGFDALALGGIGTAIITQGDGESLLIEAEAAVLPWIKSEVRDGCLMLGLEGRWPEAPRPTRPIRFFVGVRDLRALRLSGAGDAELAHLATDRLQLAVSGSGRVELGRLAAERLTVAISGSGKVAVAGEVAAQKLTISGSGDYLAGRLASASASVTVSGSGRATLRADDALDVRISGSGTVEYAGAPRLRQAITGSGRVRQVADTPTSPVGA